MTTTPQDHKPRATKGAASRNDRRRKALLDHDYSLSIDGVVYTVVPADLTGSMERRIRNEIGMSMTEVIDNLEAHPGLDLLGYFMWGVRIARGEECDLDEILDSISYASEVVSVKDKAKKKAGGPPEA